MRLFARVHPAGSAQFLRSRRPRPSSDGLSMGASVNMESVWPHPPARLSSSRSYDSLLPRDQCHGNQGETVQHNRVISILVHHMCRQEATDTQIEGHCP